MVVVVVTLANHHTFSDDDGRRPLALDDHDPLVARTVTVSGRPSVGVTARD